MPPLAQAFFAETDNQPEAAGDILDIVDSALYEAAVSVDPSAMVRSQLVIRLIPDDPADEVRGWASKEVQERIAATLCKQVSLALKRSVPSTELGLVGVGEGSVVLQFAPRVAYEPSADVLVDSSEADAAVQEVLNLNGMFESEAPAGQIMARYRQKSELLKATRSLIVDGLDACRVTMGVRWFNSSGTERDASLTGRARRHALAIFTRKEVEEPITVQGYISGIDLSGSITLVDALPGDRNRRLVAMSEEEVSGFKDLLGRWTQLDVCESRDVDEVGLRGKARYQFVRLTPHEAMLPGALAAQTSP